MMPPSGTFDYVATVPDERNAGRAWSLRASVEVVPTGNELHDARLVGLTPSLEIVDAGLTPNPGWTHGIWRPEVMRSRLLLRAPRRQGATVSQASFCVDRTVIAALRPRDQLYLARTSCGGLGLSALRGGRLIVALGAVTAVPLGDSVKARLPSDLISKAEGVFKTRDPQFELPEVPIELTIEGSTRIVLGGRSRIAGHSVSVLHGFYRGTPGTDECLAVACMGLCSETSAHASTQLMSADHIELIRW